MIASLTFNYIAVSLILEAIYIQSQAMAKFFKSKLSWSFVVVAVLVLICSCSVPAALAQQTGWEVVSI